MNNQRMDRGALRNNGLSIRTKIHTAAFLLLTSTSAAYSQVQESAPAGDPIEDTWRYLVELFRMILGL
jgi:hypothetical protein